MNKMVNWIKENKQKTLLCILGLVLFLVGSVLYYSNYVTKYEKQSLKLIRTIEDNLPIAQLNDSEIISQSFTVEQNFDGFQIKLSTTNGNMVGEFHLQIEETATGNILESWSEPITKYAQNQFYEFRLSETAVVAEPTQYQIKMWIDGTSAEDCFYYYHTKTKKLTNEIFSIQDVSQASDIIFTVFVDEEGAYSFLGNVYWIMFFAFFVILIVVFYMGIVKKVRLEWIFLPVVCVLGILYMIIMPPFTTPDEPIHFGTAYKVSSEIMGKQVLGDNGIVAMRSDDVQVDYGTIPTIDTYKYTYEMIDEPVQNVTLEEWKHSNLFSKNIITHFPGAIGISFARICNMGTIPLIYMGRIANMFFYVVLVFFAIRITPIGKMLFFAVSMTPMMLELISSYSYDAVVNALAFLSLAYILKCIYEKEKIRYCDVIILGILAALLAPCKIVYSGIFALCIFIPKKKYSKKIYYFSTLAVIVFMILLSNVYVNFGMIRAMSGTTATAVESTSASAPEQYSLMWCLQHPLGTFLIYYRTALTYGKYYFETMFGGLLGWLEIKVSNWLVHLFALITFLSAFSQSKSTDKIKKGHRIISVMIMFCVYCLVLASMFFGCTPYGVPIILGVQGRYFLAILPLLAILVGNKKWKLSQKWDSCMCLLLIVLNFVTLCQVFSTICVR